MSFQNTVNSYGTIAKTFHWLIALLIIGALLTGVIADNASPSESETLALKIRLYSMHKTIGLAIFFTALLRILWAISQPKPGAIGAHHGPEKFLAELVHWMLYASLVLVPLTGWMTHAATEGFAPIKWPFGQELPFIPNDPLLAERFALAHKFFKFTMLAALFLHIAGALKHHVWDKDATLRRMWFGRAELPSVKVHKHSILPALISAGVFAVVGISSALQPIAHGQDGPTLEEVSSEWRVLDGTIEITVDQFGTNVTGTFEDWNAAITFDPDATEEIKGSADVTVSISSLTLGNITADALSPDFLSAESFPTAKVIGDIFANGSGFELRGTITIKGKELPLTMPFELSLEGDVADVTGGVTLQRQEFGVGESMPDESTVAFDVDVRIALTATTASESSEREGE